MHAVGKYIKNVLHESTPGLVLFGEMLCLYFYLFENYRYWNLERERRGELVKTRVIRESFKAGEEGLNWDEELDGLWAG